MPNTDLSPTERITANVYGDTFRLYDPADYQAFIAPLTVRFERNSLDCRLFKNARCLDAGCGGGRGSIFMASHGAREVQAVDMSERNIGTTRQWANHFGYSQVATKLCNLVDLPFPDGHFDIVWCNGVLHHSDDPTAGFAEVARVLKPGGTMWLYLYGSGGIYWALVDLIRDALKDTDVNAVIALLLAWGTPIGRVAEFIDDWYVPWLRRYTHVDVARTLESLGFSSPALLTTGTNYDTSHRVHLMNETELFGGGDLRYFCVKNAHVAPIIVALPGKHGIGSEYRDGATVVDLAGQFGSILRQGADIARARWAEAKFPMQVGLAVQLQTRLRDLMSQPARFDLDEFRRFLVTLDSRLSLGE